MSYHLEKQLHLGDIEGSEYTIQEAAGCPVEMVAGNNDFFSNLPSEKTLQIGSYCVMITHGHRYYISMGNEMLKKEAIAQGIDIVMYGHTHKPVIDISDNIIPPGPKPGALAKLSHTPLSNFLFYLSQRRILLYITISLLSTLISKIFNFIFKKFFNQYNAA